MIQKDNTLTPGARSSRTRMTVYHIVICGMMIALSAILGGYLKFPINLTGSYTMKVSFGILPIIFLSIAFGPTYGAIAGGLADIVQANLFPIGSYNPVFTIGGILLGLIPGLFFLGYDKTKAVPKLRLFLAVLTGQIVGSVFFNSFAIHLMYHAPLKVLLIGRVINQSFHIPVFAIILYYLLTFSRKHRLIQ